MNIRLGKVVVIVVCLLAVIFLVWFAVQTARQQKDNDVDLATLTMPVVAIQAHRQPLAEKMDFVGTLRANEAVELKSQIDGIIAKINFSSGQKVKKGDALIIFDQTKLKVSLLQAEANLKFSQSTLDRYQGLLDGGGISRLDLDQAKNQVEIAESAAQAARSALSSCVVIAPFDGVMGERLMSIGQFITQGDNLGSLVNQSSMKVDFQVPERYLSQLKTGETVDVKVEAYPEDHFEGNIVYISPTIDEATRTILMSAEVSNPIDKLRQGMFADLSLMFNRKTDALVVPENAVVLDGNQSLVYVVKPDQTITVQPVDCGRHLDGMVEILRGLKEGQTVVVEGYQKIHSGSKVQVRLQNR